MNRWCGPCKLIAPVLEKLVNEHDTIRLAKLDVDAQVDLLSQLPEQVTAVPTVFGFKDGKLVGSFKGAVPEHEV